MSPVILLIGKDGQLGQELANLIPNHQQNLVAVGRDEIDLEQPDLIRRVVKEVNPSIIINCAAYTAVDKAESEPELAYTINGNAPGILAEMARQLDSYLIHVSTDYVFDGKQSHPYQETDPTNPIGVYGKSKLAGEQAIESVGGKYLILRTAWVYGVYGRGNFVKTMLRLGKTREELRVVTDQIGSPTWTYDLAGAIAQLIPRLTPELTGIYHYTNSGVASWYDFALAIFAEARELGFPLQVQDVVPIATFEYPTPAQRPAYSVLSSRKIAAILGEYAPHWRVSLREMLVRLKNL